MKYLQFLFLVLFFLCSACNKKDPDRTPVDPTPNIKQNDSSYVTAVEAPQPRNILVELNTGVQNANSPDAFIVLESIKNKYPNRISIAALHGDQSGFNEPMTGLSTYDFRNTKAEWIKDIMGVAPYPAVAIAKESFTGNTFFDTQKSDWMNRVDTMITKSYPVNIYLQTEYTPDNNNCELVAKIAFTQDIFEQLFISIYVVENEVVDYQQTLTSKKPDYIHNYIFRDCLTQLIGKELDFGGRKAGTVLQKRINFNPTTTGVNAWDLDNCKIIAFIHRYNGNDRTVFQCQEVSLR